MLSMRPPRSGAFEREGRELAAPQAPRASTNLEWPERHPMPMFKSVRTRNQKRRGTMNKIKASVVLALGIGSSLAAATSPTSAGWTDPRYNRGGFVKPCSLDGVNPVYHPYIFGDPVLAREV